MFKTRNSFIDLNGTWKFNPDPYQRCRQQSWWKQEGDNSGFFPCFNMDGMWDTQVPSTWKKEFEELKWYDGHANYARDFAVDEIPEGHEAFLCIDSATYRSEVYLNGEHVGNHEWAYSPFQFKVTDLLQEGNNRIFVLIDNFMQEDRVPGIRTDWNNDGGLTGSVRIIFVPKSYIENFRTQTVLEDDKVKIQVEIFAQSTEGETTLDYEFKIDELALSHKASAKVGEKEKFEFVLEPSQIELWDQENPKLYNTSIVTATEELNDEIGYREIKTEGEKILLNGEEIRLYGVAVHSEFPDTGRVPTAEGIELMLEKARELGCNFLRCAHYPYAEEFGKAMDRAGMLWWEEVPVYWLPNVHQEPQLSKALGMMREAVLRDWNRASLIFWSVSNECAGDGTAAGSNSDLTTGNYPYWTKACAQIRELDPSRLISSADSGHRKTEANKDWTPDAGDHFDTEMAKESWHPGHPDEFYELMDVLGANLYVSNPGDNPIATQKFVDMLKRFNKPLMITEFGSMSTTEETDRPETDLGHPVRHETILREAYATYHEHEEIVGYVPWALMDCRVPMHWRWYNRGTGTFAYGMLDNNYKKKHVFDVVQAEITKLRKRFND
ncbi:glycoside hydrolase family 2 TIM barrel-domain containing protein [Lentisphaera profundi]|uniref:Glycoside hydrolase family 2 TIM barrel-domain containing protein n=1 Tax=Lentisphaera profundi TaxID=1658616 RepID=A0ABY7VR15_9BACT|nr:glycoside hydrolase family 2 TIM barrel-domain containing protein [Lentisphaera profundi]WDE95229.1 glycoside hydrolase family 2 TIM barrel-domain containing protein [Lentisphaera profundi]